MKTFVSAIIIASSLITRGAENPVQHRIEIKNLTTEILATPQLQIDGVKDEPLVPHYWLELEAEIVVEGPNRDKVIPELKTQWYAIVPDRVELGEKANQRAKPKVLTGEILFINVRAKDGRAYLVAYIGPDDLGKLTGKDKPGRCDVEAAALVISGEGILADAKHAPGLQKATAKEELKWWSGGKYPAMEGLIVAKGKTPFAPLWCDRYPSEKEK